jgi:hypothetical protein
MPCETSLAIDVWESPQSPSQILLHGLNAAISRQRLAPLVKCLEIALSALSSTPHKGITVFSCDSFCSPHLKAQLSFYKALNRISDGQANFLNIPIAHYLTSTPQIAVLRSLRQTAMLLAANDQIVNSQDGFLDSISDRNRLSITHESAYAISAAFDLLTKLIPASEWQELTIRKFPFHELSFRDLSLTYKCTPELCQEPTSPFHEHFILTNQFNVWLLMQFIINSKHIGGTGVSMSFYTATTVFRFFCRQTNRISRYFYPFPLPSIDTGIQHDNLVCLLDSPISTCGLTAPSNSSLLSSISLNRNLTVSLNDYLSTRIKGYGSHNYSPSAEAGSNASLDLRNWISLQRQPGKVICSAFTSSLDETIGQNLSYLHENADLSHLDRSIFSCQDEWLRHLIAYFRQHEETACLIIRIHPRMARDKRGLPESPSLRDHLNLIANAIGECASIRIVLPDSNVSSYMLGLESDLILNGWSTIGLEFAMMGKLVCNAFNKCVHGGAAVYPVHLQSPRIRTVDDYRARITRLIKNAQATHCTSDEAIGAEEARKAFLSAYLCGLTEISDDAALRSQMAKPVLLTPLLCKILANGNQAG